MHYTVLEFLTDGFEEMEAVAPINILRRANINICTVSLTGKKDVIGSRGIKIESDMLFEDITDEAEMLILPGGPGTKNYFTHEGLATLVKKQYDEGRYIAAICAAPSYLAELSILDGKKATCYPSVADKLTKSELSKCKVEKDGTIITSKGPSTAIDFSLKIVETLTNKEIADKVAMDILVFE